MRFLEWLLDLDNVGLDGAEPLALEWGTSPPAWLIAALLALAVLVVTLIYRRERANLARVMTLAAMRIALLVLVVAVLCQPRVVWKRVRTEPSTVVLLVDNSLSMSTAEPYLDDDKELLHSIVEGAALTSPAEVGNLSRLDLVRAALVHDGGARLEPLLDRHRLQLAAFSGSLEALDGVSQSEGAAAIVEELDRLNPDGAMTDIAGAIDATIDQWAGSRLAGIVLASDGQTTASQDLRPALELAARRGVPIFPIRIGSGVAPIDVEVSPPRAATTVLANDVVTVETTVTARGITGPTAVEVTLLDSRDSGDEVVATETVVLSPEKADAVVELRTIPSEPGLHEFRVRAAAVASERVTTNNTDVVHVRVVDDRVRVLYVEGYPRYEYRYLKNALVRERTIDLSVLLLEADDRFVQEGTVPIRRFPETPEELNRYDVVIFGDVDPKAGWLTHAQMIMLLDFVANQGGGFAVIAGERTVPHRLFGTPLEKLLPVMEEAGVQHPRGEGFHLELTPEGKASRIFRFTAYSDDNVELITNLPEMYWMLPALRVKPGSTVLAETSNSISPNGTLGKAPLIVSGQYGGGKILFQATDDTWRWRRHTGEFLHDSFWVQVVRHLMPTSRLTPDATFAIRTDRRVYGYGDVVHVEVEVLDALLPRGQQQMKLTIESTGTAPGDSVPREESAAADTLIASRISLDPPLFEASFVPPKPGSFMLKPATAFDRGVKNRTDTAVVRVNAPDMENRWPAANHAALEQIAASTGGQVIPLNGLEEAFRAIPDRSLIIPDDVEEPLWDSKLILVVFVLIIGCEWVLRKAFGLL